MIKRWGISLVMVLLVLPARAQQLTKDQQISGSLETGIWYLTNNVLDFEDENGNTFDRDDGYGDSYIDDDYMLYHARFKLRVGDDDAPVRINTKARLLYNIKDQNLSIGIGERYRYQIFDLNVEFNKDKSNIYLGRYTNFHVGGIAVDGLTAFFHVKEDLDLGLYGGFGVDPRQFTGYIGPDYRNNPIKLDFQTAGVFTSLRKNRFTMDLAVNALFFEFDVDRVNAYTQFRAMLNEDWSLSGLLDVGLAGDTGLVAAQGFVHTQITPSITNQLGYYRFRSIVFAASDASRIPNPGNFEQGFDLGDEVNTAHYQTFSNHTKFKLQKNYVFTRVSYSVRSFDDRTRKVYTIGYRDPNIQKTGIHATLRTSLIENYKSYHALVDLMVGTDIIEQKLELEVGGGVAYNERQIFQNYDPVADQTFSEQESSLRANLIFQPTLKMAWYAQYRMYNEVDVVNNDQKVRFHEFYLSTNVRF